MMLIHVMTKVTMQIEGEGTSLEMVRQCGLLDSNFATCTSLHGHMYAYVSRGKGEQRTDRAILEIRLQRDWKENMHTNTCMPV